MNTCESLKITILVDNYIDMLLGDEPGVTRIGMPEHFAPRRGTPLAENGISFLVEVTEGGRTTTIMVDAGISEQAILHNANVLGIDLTAIDQIVVSHGHPDHFGGIYAVLGAIGRAVPVVVHPSAFRPRMITRADAVLPYFNRELSAARIEASGGRVVEVRDPLPLAPGVTTSGEIATTVDFEEEVPAGRWCICDGRVEPDPIEDYMTVVINVRGHGLVVLDPCGHSGVISSLRHSMKLTGEQTVHSIFGGFHLGHPGISQKKIENTADALADLGVKHVSPMHCSGFRAQRAIAERMPDAFRLMTVGGVVELAAPPNEHRSS